MLGWQGDLQSSSSELFLSFGLLWETDLGKDTLSPDRQNSHKVPEVFKFLVPICGPFCNPGLSGSEYVLYSKHLSMDLMI